MIKTTTTTHTTISKEDRNRQEEGLGGSVLGMTPQQVRGMGAIAEVEGWPSDWGTER